jgi:hypothetical protein
MTAATLLLLALCLAALIAALGPFTVRAWRARAPHRVICPETGRAVLVALDPLDAAFHDRLGTPELRLKSCSRWPAHAGCGQECLVQLGRARLALGSRSGRQ